MSFCLLLTYPCKMMGSWRVEAPTHWKQGWRILYLIASLSSSLFPPFERSQIDHYFLVPGLIRRKAGRECKELVLIISGQSQAGSIVSMSSYWPEVQSLSHRWQKLSTQSARVLLSQKQRKPNGGQLFHFMLFFPIFISAYQLYNVGEVHYDIFIYAHNIL